MKLRALILAASLCALASPAWAQEDFSTSQPTENPAESTGSVTFEFAARASAEKVRLGETFTIEVSVVQKWGDALENLSLDVPGLESFRQIDEQEKQNDFIDFRGESTYDTTYLLTLAPTAPGSFVIGPVAVHDESGQLMESDPIHIEVLAADETSGSVRPSAKTGTPSPADSSTGMLPYILAVLGTLAILLVALYFALSLSGGRPKAESEPVSVSPGIVPLPTGVSDERTLFADLGRRYGRDVRSLTTREIAALESDPEDRVRVTALLDRVRAARYADRS